MPFDPNAPFEAVAAPPAKPAFDPSKPFDPADRPAFDSSQPHAGFDDPVAHYASNPGPQSLTEAREAFKVRAAQPTDYVKAAGDFVKGAVPALWTGVKGMAQGVGHAVANVGTELAQPEGSPEAQRAQRENASAVQLGAMQGGDMAQGLWRNAQRLFGKTDRTLSDHEIEDQIQHEAAHRAVAQGLTQGNVVEGGAGEPLGFGRVERLNKSPEELAAAGAPVSPEGVESMSFLSNPAFQAVGPVSEAAGPLIGRTITGPALRAAGATVSGAGNVAAQILSRNHLGTIGGALWSLYTHDPLAAAGGFSAEMAAKHVAPGIGAALSEAGAEAAGALPPVGQGLIKKAFKAGATGAVTGGVLSAPFIASAQTPEEAGGALGGGLGIGGALGAFGGIKGSRATDVAAKFGQLSREGAAMQYGLGWDHANAAGMAQLDPATQDIVNAYRGRFNGKTDANGMPIQIYTVVGDDYARALQENNGGAATDTRGFISPDGTKIFLNADAATSAGKTNETLGHEAGGHLTEFLEEVSQSHDLAELHSALRDSLYDGGKPTPQFSAFMRNYTNSLIKNGATREQVATLDNRYFEKEWIAQQAAKILNGENIANFNLPKPITERITRGASDWLRKQGILPREGGEMGWGAREIKGITGQLRDILYKQGQASEAARSERATGEPPSPAAGYRLQQLETILAAPPGATSTVDEVKAYQAAQREYDSLNATINPTATAPTQSGGTATPSNAGLNRYRIAAILRRNGLSTDEAKQWADAAQGSTDEEAVVSALRDRANKKYPTQKPTASGQPESPVTVTPGATFKDEAGNTKTVTGPASGTPNVGDIVTTRDGEIRRVTRVFENTVDTARPIDPLNSRGTKTHNIADVAKVDHDYAPNQPAREPSPSLRVVPSAGGRFQIVDAEGKPTSKTTFASERDAQQSLARTGKPSTFGLPPSANGNDVIDALIEEGGIHFGKMLKEELENQFPHKGIWRNSLATSNPDMTPDEVARLMQDRGFGDGTPATLFSEITKAVEGRSNLRDQQATEEKRQKEEAKNTPNEPTPAEIVPESTITAVAAPPISSPETSRGEQIPTAMPTRDQIAAALKSAEIPSAEQHPDYPKWREVKKSNFTRDQREKKLAEDQEEFKKETHPRLAHEARIEALYKLLPTEGEGLHQDLDPLSKNSAVGEIDPENPLHQAIMEEHGMRPQDIATLIEGQNRIGEGVYLRQYKSAEQEGHLTGEGLSHEGEKRLGEYDKSKTSQVKGERQGKVTAQDKPVTILGTSATKNTINFDTFDHDKFLNNMDAVLQAAKENGERTGTEGVAGSDLDTLIAKAFNAVAYNHKQGFTGDGSRRIQTFPDHPNEGSPNATPHPIDSDLANVINMALHNRQGRPPEEPQPTKKGDPAPRRMQQYAEASARSKEALGLAALNAGLATPEGETNPLRNALESKGFDSDKVLKTPFSNLRPDYVTGGIHNTPTPGEEGQRSIHANQFSRNIDPIDLTGAGIPKGRYVSAGFMPDEAKTPQERARERIAATTLDESDPAWIQRFETLSQKEYNGKLTPKEEDEIDALQKQIIAQYGSLSAYEKQRKEEGKTDTHKPLREEMRKTPQQRARERLRGAFMPDDDASKFRHKIADGWMGTALLENTEGDDYSRWIEAKQDILHSIKIPDGWKKIDESLHTKWGSAYLYVESPDEETFKFRIGDHDASPSRASENDYSYQVSKPANLKSWANAADKAEDHISEIASFMPDTGKPEEGNTPGERLAREAEHAGVVLNVATLKGLIQEDDETMKRVRTRIAQNTGKPAKFMPTSPTAAQPQSTVPRSRPASPVRSGGASQDDKRKHGYQELAKRRLEMVR